MPREETGISITPQKLRQWFCSEMLRLGVSETHIDAFCGRVPKSVLARHYTDFSPEKLREIYDKASLGILARANDKYGDLVECSPFLREVFIGGD